MTLSNNNPPAGVSRSRGSVGAVLRTPVLWLVRGRLGPTGGVEEVLGRAELPGALAEVVRRVVRRAGLWRGERAEVAGELSAHFQDGLSAGRSAEELLREFGDERAASRLIRRAKRRGRPLAWKAYAGVVAVVGWMIVGLIGLYALLFARYLVLEPRVTRNYTAEFNAGVAAVPVGQRAWPAYRSAYLSLTAIGDRSAASFALAEDGGPRRLNDLIGSFEVSGSELERVREYVEANAGALEGVSRAAGMERLGAELTDVADVEVLRHGQVIGLVPGYEVSITPSGDRSNPALIGLTFNHLAPMRMLARMLVSDARVAFEDGDAARFERDVSAVLGMARQMREPGSLISDLVAMALQAMVLDAVDRVLEDRPEFLDDERLTRVAHVVSAIGGDGALIRFDGERRMFEDVLQRSYSDDGSGNGVLTRRGVRDMQRLMEDFGPAGPSEEFRVIGDLALGPIQTAVVADRRGMVSMYESLMRGAERLSVTPMWAWGEQNLPEVEVERIFQNDLLKTRYSLVAIMMPAYGIACLNAERQVQRRDATLAALALEVHRRRHGAYPESLGELVPGLLPTLPRDRFTGEALGYVLDEGRPVLYSRGVDRDDDGGRPLGEGRPWSRGRARSVQWMSLGHVRSAMADPEFAAANDGDLVLWPPAGRQE